MEPTTRARCIRADDNATGERHWRTPLANALGVDGMYRRALVIIGCLALLAAGCGQAAPPATKGGGPAQAPTYAAKGQVGTPTRNRDTLYLATPGAATTQVAAVAPASRAVLRASTIPGRWALPAIGLAKVPDGLSGDGSTLVLQEVGGRHTISRFAVLDSAMRKPAQVAVLHGWFDYDAVSPDGGTLYLIEHLAANDLLHYRVRSYEVANRQLDEAIVVDKRELDEASMQGLPNTRVSDGGWAWTLYRSPKGPFIHALDLGQKFAVCIDLPAKARSSDRVARLWTLTYDEPSGELHAANTALHLAVRVQFNENDPFGYRVATGELTTN